MTHSQVSHLYVNIYIHCILIRTHISTGHGGKRSQKTQIICDMTHSHVMWLIYKCRIHMRHDSCIWDMTHSYVTWLIHMWHDSSMTRSYLTRLIHMWHKERISQNYNAPPQTHTNTIFNSNEHTYTAFLHTLPHKHVHTRAYTRTRTHTCTHTRTGHGGRRSPNRNPPQQTNTNNMLPDPAAPPALPATHTPKP